jgi:hypothetical protein
MFKMIDPEKIKRWEEVSTNLKAYKKIEMDLRKEIVKELLGDDIYEKGSGEIEFDDGDMIKYKANQTVKSTFDMEAYNLADPDNYTPIELELVSDKQAVDMAVLKLIREHHPDASILKLFTDSPSAPSLSIEWI